MSLHDFCPFFNWVVCFALLSFEISSYILDSSVWLVMWFTKVSSHFHASIFICLTFFFPEQKPEALWNPQYQLFLLQIVLLVFSLMSLCLGQYLKDFLSLSVKYGSFTTVTAVIIIFIVNMHNNKRFQ